MWLIRLRINIWSYISDWTYEREHKAMMDMYNKKCR